MSANISGYQAVDWAYNLSASTGTSITVTMSGTAQYADIYYFEYSSSGPFTFDKCGIVSGGATVSPPSGEVSTAGINDLALSIIKVDQTLSNSVSPSPWTSTAYVLNGSEAVDDALNFSARSTQPIFSATSASYYAGSTIAFEDTNVAQQIYDDMTGSHEAEPHGVPSSYDWYAGPIVEQGTNPPSGTDAILWWGGLYVGPDGSSSTNTRVKITSGQLFVLSTSGTWTTHNVIGTQSFNEDYFGGQAYSEDFTGGPFTMNPTYESDGSVGIVAGTGDSLPNCPNSADTDTWCLMHVYSPYPRISFTPSNVVGVVACAVAQLELINPSGTDDRANAHFLLDTGADYYESTTGSGTEDNPGVGLGKFKWVQNSPRSYCMTDLTLMQLQANPPPINLSGVNP